MPYLHVETNRQLTKAQSQGLVERLTKAISSAKGDPASVIAVAIHGDATLSYGGDLSAPAAMLHLYDLIMPEAVTTAMTAELTKILDELGVPSGNTYIFFHETTQPHLVSWKGLTLSQLRERRSWESLRGTPQLLDTSVRGRLVHPDGTPIRGLRVELWDRHTPGDSDYLGWAWTESTGSFWIDFCAPATWAGETPSLVLKLYEPLSQRHATGRVLRVRYLVDVLNVASSKNGHGGVLEAGDLAVPYYEYDPVPPFPFCEPSSIRMNYGDGAAAAFTSSLTRWRGLGAELASRSPLPTTEQVQDAVDRLLGTGVSVTREMERAQPGSTRADSYFVDRLLNGFGAALLKVQEADADRFVLSCRFDHLDLSGHLDLPNYRLELHRRGDVLHPTKIDLQFREPGVENLKAHGRLQEPRSFTSGGAGWDHAKRVVRVNHLNIVAQLQGHVTHAHFNMEQYAIALLRNVHRNPLRDLLFPHIREVVHINTRGRAELLSEVTGSLIRTKPITMASQRAWIQASLGRLDWKGWHPRSPIIPGHRYAKVAQIYWERGLVPYVRGFFERNSAGIREHWDEIEAFAADLVANAAPLLPAGLEEDTDAGLRWCDNNEITAGSGRTKAVSAPESPSDLQELACYVLFHLTFFHTWFHENMLTDLAELRYSSPLRNGSLAPEADDSIMPTPDVAIILATTVCAIAHFRYGYMLRDEDGDVPADLRGRIEALREDFAALGFDVENLRARLNS